MTITSVCLAVFVAASWGLNAAVTKLGAVDIPPLTLLACRYLLTAMIFLPFAKIKKSEIKVMFGIAFLESVLTNGLIYSAFKYLSPTASTLLLQTGAPLAILIACVVGKEKITLKEVGGIILSLCGVVVIVGLPGINIVGCILILLSRLSWGSTQLLYKKLPSITPMTFMAYLALFALPFVLPLAWLVDQSSYGGISNIDYSKLGINMIYQVGILSLGMIVWQRLVAKYGVNKVSPFSILQIVFGIMGGIVLFGDVITPRIALGIIMVTGGVILTTYSRKKIRNEVPTETDVMVPDNLILPSVEPEPDAVDNQEPEIKKIEYHI